MSANATKKASKKAVARPKALNPTASPKDSGVLLGRGAEGMRMAQGLSRVMRGRPKKGTIAEGTSTRSLRLPNPEWDALEAIAEARGLSLHAAMREAIVQWLARAGTKRTVSTRSRER